MSFPRPSDTALLLAYLPGWLSKHVATTGWTSADEAYHQLLNLGFRPLSVQQVAGWAKRLVNECTLEKEVWEWGNQYRITQAGAILLERNLNQVKLNTPWLPKR